MKILGLTRAAVHSLAKHKLRTSLSALGVLFGVMALVAMLAVAEGAKRETLEQIEALGADNLILRSLALTELQKVEARERLSAGLRLEDAERIRTSFPRARNVAPLATVQASIADLDEGSTPEVFATTAEYFAAKGLAVAMGRALCDTDAIARRLVCVLGADVARALGSRGRLGATLRMEGELLEVVGVLARRSWRAGQNPVLSARNVNAAVFIPLGVERGVDPEASGELSEISVRMDSAAGVVEGADVIRRTMELAHGGAADYHLIVPHELLRQANRTQRIFNLVLASIAVISLLVGGIGIMNILLASVSERTREIGIRRAVGASQVHIAVQFLFEAIALTLAGAAFGVAAGQLMAQAIARFAGWNTVVTGWAIGLALLMAVAVGLSAGLYPAWRAARQDPIVALRQG